MDNFQERADDYLFKAVIAAGEYQQLGQEATDKIIESVYKAGFDNRIYLAKLANEETGLGVWEHKVIKNVLATQFVYNDIKDLKTVGIISEDHEAGVMEIAQPLGPIFALIPVTNPTSTTMFKILIALKTRNPIIISPSRKAEKCCTETVRICYKAAIDAGASEDCIQIVKNGSRELTRAIMSHKNLALTLATGGTSMVHAAYSSGNPAIGVGPGNVPVFIDKSAEIPFAVESVIASKTFDNGTICASEQSIIVEHKIANQVQKEFENQGCYFADKDEIKLLEDYLILKEKGTMNPDVVGQSANFIAKNAGFDVPENTKIILAHTNGVGEGHPLSNEILAPVLAYYVCNDYDNAIKTCIDLNYLGGIGHSAAIYANDDERISEFSKLMNAGRVLINTPSAQGAVGGLYNGLDVSLTLGCGTGGKNITTENISARHLLNIQRACRRRENALWFKFDTSRYLDESLTKEDIVELYYKNH